MNTPEHRLREPPFTLKVLVLVTALAVATAAARAEETPLYLQSPADLAVVDDNGSSAELLLLPLEDRTPRTQLPSSGDLVGRLSDAPGEEIAIPYAKIERLELFEERLLAAAKRHVAAGEFSAAFDYFARLDRDYPNHPGFEAAFVKALYAEARARFDAKEHDHALALLGTLQERSAPADQLARAVEVIGDAVLAERWERADFVGVRRAVDAIEGRFAGLRLTLAKRWLGRIEEGAAGERQRAEELAAAGRTREALRVLSGAMALDPDSATSHQLLERLSAADKTLWVGVWETADPGGVADLDRPAARRQTALVGGRLTRLDAYLPAGGRYEGEVAVDDTKSILTIPVSSAYPSAPYDLARLLLTPPGGARDSLSLFRRRVAAVAVRAEGVEATLRAPHLQPVSLVADGLPPALAPLAPGGWRRLEPPSGSEASARYERSRGAGEFDAIEEFVYSDPAKAVEALRSRQIHLLADVPPRLLPDLEATPGVRLASLRLPTLHVLLYHADSVFRARREARRALCYALACRETLDQVVLAGAERTGFDTLSAALPRGKSLSDPLRYAYSEGVEPRPFEPRLAALLLTAARGEDAAAASGDGPPARPPLPTTLTLAHPPTPVAREACEAIRDQLRAVGFGVDLVEAAESDLATGRTRFDLRYAEVTMSEPLVDVWRMFGPGGIAGEPSAPVRDALERVVAATSGKASVAALRDLHRVTHADLPLVPLWQTISHVAWLEGLEGPVDDAVDVYQSIDTWRVTRREATR